MFQLALLQKLLQLALFQLALLQLALSQLAGAKCVRKRTSWRGQGAGPKTGQLMKRVGFYLHSCPALLRASALKRNSKATLGDPRVQVKLESFLHWCPALLLASVL